MSKRPFDFTPVFEWNYAATDDVVINQGGTSSSKTVSILQVLAHRAIERSNQTITVVGQDIPNLKRGALRDFEDFIYPVPYFNKYITGYNRSDRVFKFRNGSQIEFEAYDDAQDAKNGKRQYLYINEANGVPWDVREQLAIRTDTQEFIDYNPSRRFWAHDNLLGRPGVRRFISTFEHNPYCPEKIREKILALRDTDVQKWRVYGLGLTGKIEGLVFTNYTIVDEFPEGARRVTYGQDYGFSQDPTTLIKCGLHDGNFYADEIIYSRGLHNSDIVRLMQEAGVGPNDTIVGDSAEPKTIDYLCREGFNVFPAHKGADSVRNGIAILKDRPLCVTKRSVNLLNELDNYSWKRTRDGVSLPEPEDKHNHAIDAMRYAAQLITTTSETVFTPWK